MRYLLSIPVLLFALQTFAQNERPETPPVTGPYPVMIESAPDLLTHTLYRPVDLSAFTPHALPIVVWGNGSCVNSNFNYRRFLAEVASHGMLVIAIGPLQSAAPPRPPRPENPEDWPPFETQSTQMIDALDWAFAASTRPGSPFQGVIDTQHVATMGHSCGAIQAIEAARDARVTTVAVLNSGLFEKGDPYMRRFSVDRSVLNQLEIPIGYFIGGATDIAYTNAEQDWLLLDGPAVNANLPVGHGATYGEPYGGRFAEAPIAWLRWQLRADAEARAMFVGAACGFCTHAEWMLKKKAID